MDVAGFIGISVLETYICMRITACLLIWSTRKERATIPTTKFEWYASVLARVCYLMPTSLSVAGDNRFHGRRDHCP